MASSHLIVLRRFIARSFLGVIGSSQALGVIAVAGVLFVIANPPASADEANADAPLRVVDRLFSQGNRETLGLPTIPTEHAVVYKAEADKYKFSHQQNIIVFKDKLFLLWSSGEVHEDHNGQRVLYCTSEDGIRWSQPTVLVEDPDGAGPMTCVCAGAHVDGDTLVAYYTAIVQERPGVDPKNALFCMTSEDGKTWSAASQIADGFFIEGPRQLPSGRLLLSGQWASRQPRILYTDSRDGRTGWRDASLPEVDVFTFPEPSCYTRPDKSIVMIFRADPADPWIYASVSTDNGATWTKPAKTNFSDAWSRAFAGNLPDGTSFIISNPSHHPNSVLTSRSRRRNPLTIALSDDGVVFDRAYAIHSQDTTMRFPGKNKLPGWQYPAAVVWKDHLYIAHSINKEDEGVSRIAIRDLLAVTSKKGAGEPSMDAKESLPIKLINPTQFQSGDVSAHRVPLGQPNDYKPWLFRLKNDELLMVAFSHPLDPAQPKREEHAIFWRSRDGGRTWSQRESRPDLPGREFSGSCLSDGTLIMPCYITSNDKQNKLGIGYSMLYRSEDNGKTWSVLSIGPEYPKPSVTPKAGMVNTDRSVVEVESSDGNAPASVYLGVSQPWSASAWLWKSTDRGKTWDKSLRPEIGGWDDGDGFFGQSITFPAQHNRWLHVARVTTGGRFYEIPGKQPLRSSGDPFDRMMLWESSDQGAQWSRAPGLGEFGTYGELFPRMLRLRDGRVVLTFTVRSDPTDGYHVGLRAIVNSDNCRTWDFLHDRFVIDYQNRGHTGGGYGNTVECNDGGLVSCYSYRGRDGYMHVEAVRWRLPPHQ